MTGPAPRTTSDRPPGAPGADPEAAEARPRPEGGSSREAAPTTADRTAGIDDFFGELERRGHQPMLRRLSATVRWDIVDGDRIVHRLVRIDHGDVRVAVSDEPADCVIVAERVVFEDVVSGRTSALAALLRGAAAVDGDFQLMVLAQRLLPRTPGASAGRAVAAAGARPS